MGATNQQTGVRPVEHRTDRSWWEGPQVAQARGTAKARAIRARHALGVDRQVDEVLRMRRHRAQG
ncbi:hypothetical protein SK069_12105 [Patulibacter brassicae]|jgi:hypothetical protein|uniref:Uncharacterized protein n=1 Tax=Patulibacter brassicae TaxID=1705717 RepID=A0ABU4VN94_9ACTN|nr:hypothetical protein [Patulibacter brassicae]MDX8152343.1 hypothetical protein [Patulibacter brassicae]